MASKGLANAFKLGDIVSIKEPAFGAKCTGTVDDKASIAAAIAAVPVGTILRIPGTPRIASKLTVNKKLKLVFGGGLGTTTSDLPGSYLIKDAALNDTGLEITADGVEIESGGIVGEVGNGLDNVVILANSVTMRNFASVRAGRDGFRGGSDGGGTNCNSGKLDQCRSFNNVRRGYYLHDAAPNVNGWELASCGATNNGEDGLFIDKAAFVFVANFLGEGNTGRGAHFGANSQRVFMFGGDRETNISTNVLVDAGATGIMLAGPFAEVTDNTVGGCIRLDRLFTKQGIWLPVLFGATVAGVQTYATQTADWHRGGDMCFIWGNITLSAKDAAMAGNVRVSGLPLVSDAGFTNFATIAMSQWGQITLPANYTQVHGQVRPGEQVIRLTRSGSAQTAAFVDAAEIGAAAQIVFAGWYPVSKI